MESNTDKNGFVIHNPFGNDLFGHWAENFARFFGTPGFLIGQTVFVIIWIGINVAGITSFDLYPFILLNLAFSTQAAYAAPLILLAQTRQAERDKLWERTDAEHREELHKSVLLQQQHMTETNMQILELTKKLEKLTQELHSVIVKHN